MMRRELARAGFGIVYIMTYSTLKLLPMNCRGSMTVVARKSG
jgi:hypothetical protein